VLAETRFRAMGSTAHVLVDAAHTALLPQARRRLSVLESLWSRFLPDSELSRLNALAGGAVEVSPETAQIVRRCVEAWHLTEGLFDPTVLAAVESAGYDRSFEQVARASEATPRRPVPNLPTPAPAPGCAGIEVDGAVVRLPAGVRLDLGGIGKGYAADLLAYELRQRGATGACVNLGGDVRASGPARAGSGWTIGVNDPFERGSDLTRITLDEGAVATSSRLRRRWRRGSQEQHHLIDPRTGEPSRSSLVSVTVVAAQTHWAEILAKAALIAGKDAGSALLDAHGLSALLVAGNGDVVRVGPMEEYEGWTRSSGGTSPARVV
jgi:FAD:protein FMN transferase